MTIDASLTTASSPPRADQCTVLPPPALRRALRKLAGDTQEQVAAEFGVSDGAISYWERSPAGPGRRHQRRYLRLLLRYAEEARSLGVDVQWPSPHASTQK